MLWPFNHYPGSDYETFNYDWIIGKLKELKDSVAAAKASEDASEEYANNAKEYMQDAKSAKTQAAIFASQAGEKATDAANSAASIQNVVGQVNTNTARIDDLIATAGDGTVPSELTDIRVGADSFTYSTAGNAVRTQGGAPFYEGVMSMYDAGYQRGTWTAAGTTDDSAGTGQLRVRTLSGVRMMAGDYIVNHNPAITYQVMFRPDTADDLTAPVVSSWCTGDTKYTAPYDGYADVFVRRTDWAAIADADVEYITKHVYFVKKQVTEAYNNYGQSMAVLNAENIDQMAATGTLKFNADIFHSGGMTNGVPQPQYEFRIYSDMLRFDYPVTITVESPARFDIQFFDDQEAYVNNSITTTGDWTYDELTIPADTNFRIVASPGSQSQHNEDHRLVEGIIPELVKKYSYTTKNSYQIETMATALAITGDHTVHGEPLNMTIQKFNGEISPINCMDMTEVSSIATYQGFAICNGVLFQMFNGGKVELIDYATGDHIALLDIVSDHGNSIDFSAEYYDPNDEFPLAYISSSSNPAKVYVNRITRTGTTLIRTFNFPLNITGYYACHVMDKYNNKLYMLGYTQEEFSTNTDGTNFVKVTKWDLDHVIDNGSNNFTPTLEKSFTLPYIYTMQGQTMHDGKLVVASSYTGTPPTKLVVIDPGSERICTVLDDLPLIWKQTELEGIAFVENGSKYDIVGKPFSTQYYVLKF